MTKRLVAYFSATGTTEKAAKALAEAAGADLFEIVPSKPYKKADLNWLNPLSRSSKEMRDRSSRPEISALPENIGEYGVVFLGFPVWWYREPSIIDTFLESCDFSGKKIVLFATSGGSGLGKTAAGVRGLAPSAEVVEGGLLNGSLGAEKLASWLGKLPL